MFGFIKKLLGASSSDLDEWLSKDAVIIDVRTPGEYQQGHVKGSINIPLQRISNEVPRIKKMNKPVITCCASGMRSGSAANQLRKVGIEAKNGGSWQAVASALNK